MGFQAEALIVMASGFGGSGVFCLGLRNLSVLSYKGLRLKGAASSFLILCALYALGSLQDTCKKMGFTSYTATYCNP